MHQKQTPYMYGQLSRERIFLNPVKEVAVALQQPDPSATQPCDELAAEPGEATSATAIKGIKLEEIKTTAAVRACSEAVRQFPGVDRFHYQLGRALFAAGDYPSALASYRKAVALGNTRALYALGAMHENGNGVDKDPARARFYCEIAAERNFAPALVSLGLQQERGLGGAKDPTKAYSLYRIAAALGSARAVNKMGELVEKGLGVAQDAKQARAFYEKSASMGDEEAMVNLARCYAHAIGGSKDLVKARKLLAKAAQGGSSLAREILVSIERPKQK